MRGGALGMRLLFPGREDAIRGLDGGPRFGLAHVGYGPDRDLPGRVQHLQRRPRNCVLPAAVDQALEAQEAVIVNCIV
jgi:hypothetical protein